MHPSNLYLIESVRVIDGDTIVADVHIWPNIVLTKQHIRFSHVDAPERADPMFIAAKQSLVDLINKATQALFIRVENPAYDKYGRVLASLFVDGCDASEWLLIQGYVKKYKGG